MERAKWNALLWSQHPDPRGTNTKIISKKAPNRSGPRQKNAKIWFGFKIKISYTVIYLLIGKLWIYIGIWYFSFYAFAFWLLTICNDTDATPQVWRKWKPLLVSPLTKRRCNRDSLWRAVCWKWRKLWVFLRILSSKLWSWAKNCKKLGLREVSM